MCGHVHLSRKSSVCPVVARNPVTNNSADELSDNGGQVDKFKNRGFFAELLRTGRLSTSTEKADAVRQSFAQSPKNSVRRASLEISPRIEVYNGYLKRVASSAEANFFVSGVVKWLACVFDVQRPLPIPANTDFEGNISLRSSMNALGWEGTNEVEHMRSRPLRIWKSAGAVPDSNQLPSTATGSGTYRCDPLPQHRPLTYRLLGAPGVRGRRLAALQLG
ncbi:hypothetical protein PR048_018580 [Dryococelus australis]|uniref:Uncharacterized protein n=1 Tax=Dryococelus australis TaxID=614101 RepID=A0ABQ9HCN4_9NEOP|nr:hypothetical protein PR048_018580 [Dryococelus australis]